MKVVFFLQLFDHGNASSVAMAVIDLAPGYIDLCCDNMYVNPFDVSVFIDDIGLVSPTHSVQVFFGYRDQQFVINLIFGVRIQGDMYYGLFCPDAFWHRVVKLFGSFHDIVR